ncbi:MAG TPA: RNA methyltransferase [Desulfomonilaceae bacterium]|nr:RNA methyltransferase [Desulfomonilaceae bacterium]
MTASRLIQRGFRVHPEWAPALENIHVILVGITHAGNIGAIARVMKNMGLHKLTLVSSTSCGPESEALAMASGAYEVVEQAQRIDDLRTALEQTIMAVGTSGRLGGKRTNAGTPAEVIPMLVERALVGPVACVFGRESKGLTNEELKLCTHHMIIPTDAHFASMNIAHAAAVTAYEIFKITSMPVGFQARKTRPASVKSREDMFQHIEDVLTQAGFLDRSNPLRMMRDIRRIFNSAGMDDRDVKIVRGLFRKISNTIRIADDKAKRGSDEGECERPN